MEERKESEQEGNAEPDQKSEGCSIYLTDPDSSKLAPGRGDADWMLLNRIRAIPGAKKR